MPIHDQTYRRYQGQRLPPGRAWSVIARTGIRSQLRKRIFMGLLLLSWLPFIVRLVQIYASANIPQASFLAPSAQTFRDFLGQQQTFLFFVTVYVGAGLIANDRRANALQIYLSKPLSRVEYVAGKLAILMSFLLFVSWVPAMLLLVAQVLFAGNVTFFVGNLALVPAITLFAAAQTLTFALAMLALSSLSKSSRYVGILFAALVFFSEAVYGVLFAITRSSRFSWVAVTHNLSQVGDLIFRLPLGYDTPIAFAFVSLVTLAALSVLVLERRVRGVEVVA
jgi:ABC-2 type transport system permease protein